MSILCMYCVAYILLYIIYYCSQLFFSMIEKYCSTQVEKYKSNKKNRKIINFSDTIQTKNLKKIIYDIYSFSHSKVFYLWESILFCYSMIKYKTDYFDIIRSYLLESDQSQVVWQEYSWSSRLVGTGWTGKQGHSPSYSLFLEWLWTSSC